MSGIRLSTSGESHGYSLLAFLEGIPAGLLISPEIINTQLRRLHTPYSLSDDSRIINEDDEVSILSGVRSGETIGLPITLQVENRHAGLAQTVLLNSLEKRIIGAWNTPRPGYPDLAGAIKYGYRDLRIVEECTGARETVIRVAAGTIARRFLQCFGIHIFSHITAIGPEKAMNIPADADELQKLTEISSIRCSDPDAANRMILALESARKKGETLGGVFELIATGVPIGLGSYAQWTHRIDALIGQALLSIPGTRGIEFGDGFAAASQSAGDVYDPIYVKKFRFKKNRPTLYRRTNHSGGIEGGVTNGNPIVVRCALAPAPGPIKSLHSVNLQTLSPDRPPQIFGEVCMVLPMGVLGESILGLVIADAFLQKFSGDSMDEIKENVESYHERLPFLVTDRIPDDEPSENQ